MNMFSNGITMRTFARPNFSRDKKVSFIINIKNEALERNTKITINQKDYYPKYKKAINGFYEMGSQETEVGFIVFEYVEKFV